MEIAEIREKIVSSPNKQWFDNLIIQLNLPHIEIHKTFKGFTTFFEFIDMQLNGWNEISVELPSVLERSKKFFNEVANHLEAIINLANSNVNQLQSQFSQGLEKYLNKNKDVLIYNCPETDLLFKINEYYPNYISHAFNFIYSGNVNIRSKDELFASILVYEFMLKDYSKITERRNAEKSSISKLRNDFEKYIEKSETQLNSFLKNSENTYKEYIRIIDQLQKDKEEKFDNWFNQFLQKNETTAMFSEKSLTNLTETYEELLRLKAPAEYWNTRAADLKKQGWKSLKWLIVLVSIGVVLLFTLLIILPGDLLEKIFQDTGTAIKWSIIFVTFISFLAYGIRLLAKVSFSAFHLARDAEEREQLTYLYLSLKNDGNVEDSDRQLVLQSLFSRADTGLLKDDSAPTMPGVGGLLEKAMSGK